MGLRYNIVVGVLRPDTHTAFLGMPGRSSVVPLSKRLDNGSALKTPLKIGIYIDMVHPLSRCPYCEGVSHVFDQGVTLSARKANGKQQARFRPVHTTLDWNKALLDRSSRFGDLGARNLCVSFLEVESLPK
jgi:hypothetical protein